MKRLRDLAAMVAELTDDYEVELSRGDHVRITLRGPKGERSVFAPFSPSDRRGKLNTRADLRRAAREVGA